MENHEIDGVKIDDKYIHLKKKKRNCHKSSSPIKDSKNSGKQEQDVDLKIGWL